MTSEPIVALYVPERDVGADSSLKKAVEAYAKGKGWQDVEKAVFETNADTQPVLETTMRRLVEGDILVVPFVSAFGDRPSVQRSRILNLLARGVNIHSLDVNGPIDGQLLALKISWSAMLPMERRYEEMRLRLERREADMAKEMEEYQQTAIERALNMFGARRLHTGPDEDTIVGTHLRAMREAKKLTQEQLARAIGSNTSNVSRVERTGKGQDLAPILQYLTGVSAHNGAVEQANVNQ